MNPAIALAANTCASPLRRSAAARSNAAPYPARTAPAMALVTLAHALALFGMLYTFEPAPLRQPVISFTVTLMDLSVSHNTVSSAAATPSSPAAIPEKKAAEKAAPVKRAAQPKKTAKASPLPVRKSAQVLHNAREQTAVLAPITPAQFDAAYLNNPPPAYPALSRRLGEQGSVVLAVYVSENGRAENVTLKKSSGYGRLDRAAMAAVSGWHFAAARQGEQLVASWVNVPVKFVLE